MNDEESLSYRVIEELKHRAVYGQPSNRIFLGEEAWAEMLRLHLCLGINIKPEQGLFFGMPVEIKSSLPPTCFEIQ